MAISRHHLRQLTLGPEEVERTDGQLLESFVSRGEGAALEALVQRHGPMVWGVCCRLLNHHDAQDAFQATFLVLIRKAASIVPRDMVGNWLYGVAYQTALNAQMRIAKQGSREVQVIQMPELAVVERDTSADLQPLLDRELCRLPNKYRAAIVLCDLEGKSRKEAARQLGLPEGTIASRLARGKAILASRLARHGLAVSGGMLEVALSQKASGGAVPAAVMASTIKTLTLIASGQSASGVISVEVANLAEGVLKAMFLIKLKTTLAALLLVAIAAVGAIGVGLSARAQTPKVEQPVPLAEKLPQAPRKADDSTKLLKTRLDAAKAAYKGAWESLGMVRRNGNTITNLGNPEEVYTWSVRLLNAQLDMSDKRDEHIAALEEHIQRMNELQKKVTAMAPDLLQGWTKSAAEWYLAEAELRLAKEKAK